VLVSLDINEVQGSNPIEINWINLNNLQLKDDISIIKIIIYTKNFTKSYIFLQSNEILNYKKIIKNNQKIINYLNNNNINWEIVDNQIHNILIGNINSYYDDSNVDIIKENSLEKKFLCLNGKPARHRKDIYDFLITNDLKKETFLSYNSSDINLENHLLIPGDFPTYENNNKINSFYYKSFCNIITETAIDNSYVHITEKTDKSIFALQPFILVGNPYSLKKLHELGFKTFDKWWDESYDNEFDYYHRLEKIKNTIKYVSNFSLEDCKKIYNEMEPILVHNKLLAKKIYNYNKKYIPNKIISLNLNNGEIVEI